MAEQPQPQPVVQEEDATEIVFSTGVDIDDTSHGDNPNNQGVEPTATDVAMAEESVEVDAAGAAPPQTEEANDEEPVVPAAVPPQDPPTKDDDPSAAEVETVDHDGEAEEVPLDEFQDTTKERDSLWAKASSSLHALWHPQNWGQKGVQRGQDLATDETALKYSLWALQFNVVASAINTKLLNPNFAIMATPDANEDSFPDTDPFDFNSATYFLPLSSLMGVAIASIFTGNWSDRLGRKHIIQVSSVGACIGSVVMYAARKTFWGFCAASFAAGLFKGTLPVAMAYVGDVFTTKKEKQDALSVIVGYYVLGNSGGGIFAILMNDSGLFTPLFLGAAFVLVSFVLNIWYLIEPRPGATYTPIANDKLAQDDDEYERLLPTKEEDVEHVEQATEEADETLPKSNLAEDGDATKKNDNDDDDDETVIPRPEHLDNMTLWHIVMGAFADNVGSTALFPLCLSPLALEQYHLDFVNAEPPEDPIMSISAYQWLSVLVALMVIPGTLITPRVFAWIGAAGGCVFGNLATAILTMALLFIGNGVRFQCLFVCVVGGFKILMLFLDVISFLCFVCILLTPCVVWDPLVCMHYIYSYSTACHDGHVCIFYHCHVFGVPPYRGESIVDRSHVGFDCARRKDWVCARLEQYRHEFGHGHFSVDLWIVGRLHWDQSRHLDWDWRQCLGLHYQLPAHVQTGFGCLQKGPQGAARKEVFGRRRRRIGPTGLEWILCRSGSLAFVEY